MPNTRTERPAQVIKTDITPISTTLKVKIVAAMQSVVDKIKEKHLN